MQEYINSHESRIWKKCIQGQRLEIGFFRVFSKTVSFITRLGHPKIVHPKNIQKIVVKVYKFA